MLEVQVQTHRVAIYEQFRGDLTFANTVGERQLTRELHIRPHCVGNGWLDGGNALEQTHHCRDETLQATVDFDDG